jgi:hypothetical protein
MEYGYIKDTTIQAIADGIRDAGIVPKYKEVQIPFKFKTPNATSLDDPTPTEMHPYNGYRVAISTLPEAVSTEVHIKVGYLDKSAVTGAQGTMFFLQTNSANGISPDCPYIDIYADSPREYTIKVPAAKFDIMLKGIFNAYPDWLALNITAYGLDKSGFRIWSETDEIIKVTTEEMVEAINNCPPLPPKSAFTIKGACTYSFSGEAWNWFLINYADKLTSKDITNANNMFYSNPIERIPVTLNLSTSCDTSSMFKQCKKLQELPPITNFTPGNELCLDCLSLTSLNGNVFTVIGSNFPANKLFPSCYKLKSLGDLFKNVPDVIAGNSIFGMYDTFNYCYSLKEITDLPYVYSTYGDYYFFGACFKNCAGLRKLTFRNQVVGVTTKTCTLDLTSDVGWVDRTTGLNRGLPESKMVNSVETYQALKNDPDWWASYVEYSSYNHDSAVETINSLPDVSINGVKNTIKFKGIAGSKTDGGAINTLTPEEIAVADAKGWLVTLV